MNCFTLKDRINFYKKKWLKEHIAFMIFLGLIDIAIFVTGFILKESLLGYVAILLLIIFHVIRYNKMMTYVEQNAYDGKDY